MAGSGTVIVVGAGAAGLTAAIRLARAGFGVTILEAAAHPGEDNGFGCVYDCTNLAHEDLLGPKEVEELPWERRLVERGLFATDGRHLFGLTYRDPEAFRHCYTALRSRVDRHLATIAVRLGAELHTGTEVKSLIRERGRVIGVSTTRGAFYGDLVFLAEGDAAHLVAREGYERSSDPRDTPRFFLAVSRNLLMPSGAIEDRFGIAGGQAAAYEIFLRNGTLAGREVLLNARAFVQTNRQTLSVGLLLPADNLQADLDGNPAKLLDRLGELPAFRNWFDDGRPQPLRAKVLRGGGARDIPRLADEGLAVGGSAASLGTDFPFLNYLRPATKTGQLLAQAAVHIRADGGSFSQEALRRHYVEPLQRTSHWRDVHFLRRWPGYMRTSALLFGPELDVVVQTAAVWTRPDRGVVAKWFAWLRVLGQTARQSRWPDWRADLRELARALRLRELAGPPQPGWFLIEGTLNALRDLFGRRQADSAGGTARIRFWAADRQTGSAPWLVRQWFGRFATVLTPAARSVFGNDDGPLAPRLGRAVRFLIHEASLPDLLGLIGILIAAGLSAIPLVFWYALRRRSTAASSLIAQAAAEKTLRKPSDFRPEADTPLPFVALRGPRTHPDPNRLKKARLTALCPGGVFEMAAGLATTSGIQVHPERCIRCEACWRTTPFVDWGRSRPEAGIGPVSQASALSANSPAVDDQYQTLLNQIEVKLYQLDHVLGRAAGSMPTERADYLQLLARYVQQLVAELSERLRYATGTESLPRGEGGPSTEEVLRDMAEKVAEGGRHVWDGRYAWAAADGLQIRQHHLFLLRRRLAAGAAMPANRHQPEAWPNGISSETVCDDESAASERRDPARVAALRLLVDAARVVPERTVDAYRQHGRRLLHEWRADGSSLDPFGEADFAALLPRLLQRKALERDFARITGMRDRLVAAVNRFLGMVQAADGEAPPQEDEDDFAEGLGRLHGLLLGSTRLLAHLHRRLEDGNDAEAQLALLQVWLKMVAEALDIFEVDWRLASSRGFAGDDLRPVVEPLEERLPDSPTAFLASAAPYRSGQFLTSPLDLTLPRLVPEMMPYDGELGGRGDLRPRLESSCIEHAWAVIQDVRSLLERSLPKDGRSSGVPGPSAQRQITETGFLLESVAYEVWGRAAHRDTLSLRLEATLAAWLGEELLATTKARTDSMGLVLSHSAEDQLEVILRALVEEVMPYWSGNEGTGQLRHLGREALALEALKSQFRQAAVSARDVLEESLSGDVLLRRTCTELVNASAWLHASASVLGRLAWLSHHSLADDGLDPHPNSELAHRALARARERVLLHLKRFEEEMTRARRGYHVAEAWTASVLSCGVE